MNKLWSLTIVSFYLFLVASARSQSGQVDPTFQPGRGPNGTVRAILPLSDGSILVAGDFSQWNGEPSGSVVRLHADGSRDTTFATDVTRDIDQLFVQQGGVIAVGEGSLGPDFTTR